MRREKNRNHTLSSYISSKHNVCKMVTKPKDTISEITPILWVCLDRTYFAEIENWKHYSKIIFKCVNSTVGPIFNEKVAEKWNLWVSCTVHGTHKIDKGAKKSTNYGYCSWTVAVVPLNAWAAKKKKGKKKKKEETQTWNTTSGSKPHLSLLSLV